MNNFLYLIGLLGTGYHLYYLLNGWGIKYRYISQPKWIKPKDATAKERSNLLQFTLMQVIFIGIAIYILNKI